MFRGSRSCRTTKELENNKELDNNKAAEQQTGANKIPLSKNMLQRDSETEPNTMAVVNTGADWPSFTEEGLTTGEKRLI